MIIVISNQVDDLEDEKKDLMAERDRITQAQEHLNHVGNEELDVFKQNVGVLQSYWSSVRTDASKIKEWLAMGALFTVCTP